MAIENTSQARAIVALQSKEPLSMELRFWRVSQPYWVGRLAAITLTGVSR
jgi:hypothetical protein